jgi:transposase
MVKRAIGRAYLAFCPPKEQDVILQIVRQSDHPDDLLARDERAVREILNDTKKRGYSLSDPVANTISPTIAVPIFDEDRVIASLGLTWFSSVMTIKQVIDQLLPELQVAVESISARLKKLRGRSDTGKSAHQSFVNLATAESPRRAGVKPSKANNDQEICLSDVAIIEGKYSALKGRLDETTLRLWAAAEARALGRGGVSIVAKGTGLSRTTIYVGMEELKSTKPEESVEPNLAIGATARRVRAQGGGRKKLIEKDTTLLRDIEALIEPVAQGYIQSPLRWTCKSTSRLAMELAEQGHHVSQRSVCDILAHLGYILQAPHKTRRDGWHSDWDAQFHYIAALAAQFQAKSDPVISVDIKKKELLGDSTNGKRQTRPNRDPELVCAFDFIDPKLDNAAPSDVHEAATNQGWVSIGVDHDNAEFAVESIRHWWIAMGQPFCPQARRLLITADCVGGNGYRIRQWRVLLQKLADELNLTIQFCHFPSATSKWNKIDHRMTHITNNWRGHPLISCEVMVNLIGSTITVSRTNIRTRPDEGLYEAGTKVSNEQLEELVNDRSQFHEEWNLRFFSRQKLPSI